MLTTLKKKLKKIHTPHVKTLLALVTTGAGFFAALRQTKREVLKHQSA